MKPIVCAACGKVLTSALWDKDTEQLYCRQCITPLPPRPQRRQPTVQSKINSSDMNFMASSE
jgi:DNA-binding IclR family transcriptional regulator